MLPEIPDLQFDLRGLTSNRTVDNASNVLLSHFREWRAAGVCCPHCMTDYADVGEYFRLFLCVVVSRYDFTADFILCAEQLD